MAGFTFFCKTRIGPVVSPSAEKPNPKVFRIATLIDLALLMLLIPRMQGFRTAAHWETHLRKLKHFWIRFLILFLLGPYHAKADFVLTNLASFNNYGEVRLTAGFDGCVYGVSWFGGDFGAGTVFRMTTGGTVTTLVSLSNAPGIFPAMGLIQATDGKLYGAAAPLFGPTNSQGTIFQVSTNGTEQLLANFYGTNGSSPSSPLLQSADGFLYGTTAYGGAYTNTSMGFSGYGTIFRLSTNGALTTLYSFDNTNGATPSGELVQDKDGTLFGTTFSGGPYDFGSVWKLGTNGIFSTLAFFVRTNGAKPTAGLMRGKDGDFYGTTSEGGTNLANFGSIFKISRTTGAFTTLGAFNRSNGQRPTDVPVVGADGNLYGTTYLGGDTRFLGDGYGVLFQLSPSGVLSAPMFFEPSGLSGQLPRGDLVPGPNGSFFGVSGDPTGKSEFIFQLVPTGGENLTDPARAAADDDGDKLSNLLEYALGSDLQNPTDSHDGFFISPALGGAGDHLIIKFKRRVDAALQQLQYTLEVSSDGQTWYSDSAHLVESNVTPGYDGFDWVTITDLSTLSSAPRFARLRIDWGSASANLAAVKLPNKSASKRSLLTAPAVGNSSH